ncbi:MAG: hypothetical protein AAGI38_03520 [Bacteroidota bacterium]
MGFRKEHHQHGLWLQHCDQHKELIHALPLSGVIFDCERQFREFASYGAINGRSIALKRLSDELWEKLFEFVTSYFEMDMELFDEFNRVQILKGKT